MVATTGIFVYRVWHVLLEKACLHLRRDASGSGRPDGSITHCPPSLATKIQTEKRLVEASAPTQSQQWHLRRDATRQVGRVGLFAVWHGEDAMLNNWGCRACTIRFIQGKCVVLFVRGLPFTNWACKCWMVSISNNSTVDRRPRWNEIKQLVC